MLYDEEGRAYVEPPLLPDEQVLMYIVRDYIRMRNENVRLASRNDRLRKALKRMGGLQFAYYRIVLKLREHIGAMMKEIRSSGGVVPPEIWDYYQELRKKRF